MPMVFPTSPTVGQVFTSGGRSWVWTGSTWDSPSSATAALSGLTLIRTESFNGVTSVSLNSVFSSLYDSYKVVITAKSSTDANRTWALRLRNGLSDDSSASYNLMAQGIYRNGSLLNTTGTSVTSATILPNSYYMNEQGFVTFDVINPFLTIRTSVLGLNAGVDSAHFFHQSLSAMVATFNSYDGFTVLNSSGNFTDGTVSVYGYRKA